MKTRLRNAVALMLAAALFGATVPAVKAVVGRDPDRDLFALYPARRCRAAWPFRSDADRLADQRGRAQCRRGYTVTFSKDLSYGQTATAPAGRVVDNYLSVDPVLSAN